MYRDNKNVYLVAKGSSQVPRSFLKRAVCGSPGALITSIFPAAQPTAVGLCSHAVTPLCHFSWRRKLEPHG